jgi:hypothetical protein
LYQIRISHTGLSTGEIEAINNLFSKYGIDETKTDHDFDYASILELEFIKDNQTAFFDFISIDKWAFLIEIIKNIKKRRGKKGLKFKTSITEINKYNGSNGYYDEEPVVLTKIVFLLNHRNDLDFNKGLERIEIVIENFYEMGNSQKSQEEEEEEEELAKNRSMEKVKTKYKETGGIDGRSIIFKYDEHNRKWIRST